MIKRSHFVLFVLLVLSSLAIFGFGGQGTTQIDRKELRDMLTQLGYEVTDIVKDAGKEKYSSKFTKNELDIPVGYEISPSGKYIWLTVNLGDAPKEPATKLYALLNQNAKLQPCFFYITDSGRLMVGLPLENKNVTNADLRARSELISDSVGKSKEIWQK